MNNDIFIFIWLCNMPAVRVRLSRAPAGRAVAPRARACVSSPLDRSRSSHRARIGVRASPAGATRCEADPRARAGRSAETERLRLGGGSGRVQAHRPPPRGPSTQDSVFVPRPPPMGVTATHGLLPLAVVVSSCSVLVESQPAPSTVSFSPVDFKTCASGAEFKLTNKDGIGQIVDGETGRCLTVKKCTTAWPSTACTNACEHGNGDVVVLEDCSLDDTW